MDRIAVDQERLVLLHCKQPAVYLELKFSIADIDKFPFIVPVRVKKKTISRAGVRIISVVEFLASMRINFSGYHSKSAEPPWFISILYQKRILTTTEIPIPEQKKIDFMLKEADFVLTFPAGACYYEIRGRSRSFQAESARHGSFRKQKIGRVFVWFIQRKIN